MVENLVNNYQIEENNVTENQINNFPKTTKFLEKLKNEDKKNKVQKVLGNGELKNLFENDNLYRKNCYEELKNCENNEEVILSIILAKLPEGYIYDVSVGDIIKVDVKNADYAGANITEKKKEQAEIDVNQAEIDVNKAEEKKEQTEEKKEQAEEKKEQTEEKKEQTELDINQEEEKKEQVENNEKTIEEYMQRAKDARNALAPEGSELDNLTKEGSVLYEQCKVALERNGVIDQLRDSGLDEVAVKDYIVLNVTFREIKNDDQFEDLRRSSEFTAFYIALKQLNNECKIPDTTVNSFSERNIRNTRAELFDDRIGNKGLIEQKEKNKEEHSHDYEELFEVKDEQELIGKYGKFLSGSWAQLYQKWQQNTISKDDYEVLVKRVEKEQQDVEEKTKNLTEELCMTAQIKGILDCIPKKYSTNFRFNKANEISMDEGNFQLDGHVDGVAFSLKQNMDKEDARLQTLTGLSGGKDGFDLSGVYKDSPFVLPTSRKIFETALLSIKSDELSKITDKNDYFKILEKLILKDIDKLYVGTEYAHRYVDSQIKSELILDDTKKIFSKFGVLNSKLGKNNGKCYDFFDTLNHNLQYMTLKEKGKFHDCMRKLGSIINEGCSMEGNSLAKDEDLAKFLGSKRETTDIINGKGGLDENSLSLFDFFTFFVCQDERNDFGNRKMLNLRELSKFVSMKAEGCPIAMGRLELRDKINADKFLDEEMKKLIYYK